MERKHLAGLIILISAVLFLALIVTLQGYFFTRAVLVLASSRGVYPTAEVGSIDNVQEWYQGIDKIRIDYAGPASFGGVSPHIWYVGWTVWAEKDGNGNPVRRALKNYRRGGGYWLHTKDGWIQYPEGAFPWLIGFSMKIYGLAGPGQSAPAVERPGRTVYEAENY